MKLVRLVTLYFPSLSQKWHDWKIVSGHVTLEAMGFYQLDNKVRLLVSAETSLRYLPKLTSANHIAVPLKERKQLEAGIESIANLISVSEGVERSISSPNPCVVLIATNSKENDFLEKAEGFLRPSTRNFYPSTVFNIDIEDKLEALSDRPDGVVLLAESLAHNHATGKFHEYIRLFERAFRLSAKRVVEQLANYLEVSSLGYTKEEIGNWIKLRDPATHADERENFVLESDVRPVISRMEQAAYDVLFNKLQWRDPTIDRRNVLKLVTGTNSADGSIFATQAMAGSLKFQMFDEFGAYPFDMTAGLNSLPENWWYRPFFAAG